MTGQMEYGPGSFAWADLAARELGVAKDFYVSLFDWTLEEVPMGCGAVYSIFRKGDKQVCGMYEMCPDMREGDHPSYWQSYVAVENTDETAKKAAELGARLIQEPYDVPEAGRMAVIRDPADAILSLWQLKEHEEVPMMNQPGAISWNELLTRDLERAASFYAALFGWTSVVKPSPAGGDYTVFQSGEEHRAGMLEIRPDMGDMSPCWVVYFGVENLDAALEKAKSLGGKGTFDPLDIPDVGRIGGIADPQGACFTAMESAMASVGSSD